MKKLSLLLVLALLLLNFLVPGSYSLRYLLRLFSFLSSLRPPDQSPILQSFWTIYILVIWEILVF